MGLLFGADRHQRGIPKAARKIEGASPFRDWNVPLGATTDTQTTSISDHAAERLAVIGEVVVTESERCVNTLTRFVERQLARLHLLVALPIFGLLLLTLFWTVIYFRLADERAIAIEDATTGVELLSQEYANTSARALRQIDQITQFVKFAFEQQVGGFRLDALLSRKGILPRDPLLRVTLSDARGDGLAGVHVVTMANVADRDYFNVHARQDTDLLYISRPLLEPYSTQWSIVVSRRLNHDDGSFAGIVAIALPQSFLTEFSAPALTNDSFIGLLGADGKLRACRVGNVQYTGEQQRLSDWVKPIHSKRPIRVIPASTIDPVNRIVGFAALDQFPLQAIVGIDQDRALAQYHYHRAATIWWGVVGSLGVIVFIGMLMLQSARVRRSELAAASAQGVFRAAIEGSLDALTILRTVEQMT